MNKILCVALLLGLAMYSNPIVQQTVGRFIDDHWFGVQSLTTELHTEFDLLADPIIEKLQNDTDKHMRRAAVAAYERHFGYMAYVDESVAREQKIGMGLVSDALDGVLNNLLLDTRITASIAQSKFNQPSQHISPSTFALVFRVLNARKKMWTLRMEQASDRVRVELQDKDAVVKETFNGPRFNKQVEPSYYEKLTTFATECIVIFGSVRTLALFQ
jgi:hypothetical protein